MLCKKDKKVGIEVGILYALLPAIFWGSIVLISVKLGGNAYQQTLGITLGAFLFSIVAFFIKMPELTPLIFAVSVISGIFWSIGQMNQLSSVAFLGVSKAVPLSTGMQLVSTTLFGVMVFKEWQTMTVILIGSCAILLIIAGVVMTSLGQKKNGGENGRGNFKKGIIILLISTVGYVGYVVILRWFDIDGWSALVPQSVGMLLSSLAISLKQDPFSKYTFRNIIAGLIWSTGNLGLLLAIPLIGVAVSFSMSQTGIVISTLGGIYLLKEKASRTSFVIAGCLMIIAGGVLLGFTK
ncbi:glucose transporter GlcU [Bacillus safensis]|nr:GRP family sugar transporter [Bacillus safensis]MBR0601984.1 glucose transporter GlcU [Bacillus safensis]PCK11802.1 glucose transporter GlcU [Bacillus safensis]